MVIHFRSIGGVFRRVHSTPSCRLSQHKERFADLHSVLLQIHELETEDLNEAGRAASRAKEEDVRYTEIEHPGAKVWRLRERLQETAEPFYPYLSQETKENIDRIDDWITKLRKGVGATGMVHQWVSGEAGEVLNNTPQISLRWYQKYYFLGHETDYQTTMEKKQAKETEIKEGLEIRQEKLQEMGYDIDEDLDGTRETQ